MRPMTLPKAYHDFVSPDNGKRLKRDEERDYRRMYTAERDKKVAGLSIVDMVMWQIDFYHEAGSTARYHPNTIY